MTYVRTKEIPPGSERYYRYLQKSEREGGSVKTETVAYLGPASGPQDKSVSKSELPEDIDIDEINKDDLGATEEMMYDPDELDADNIELTKIEDDPEGVDNTYSTTIVKEGKNFEKEFDIEITAVYDEDFDKVKYLAEVTVDGETHKGTYDPKREQISFKSLDRPQIKGKEIGGLKIDSSETVSNIKSRGNNMSEYIEKQKEKQKEEPVIMEVEKRDWRHGTKKIFDIEGRPNEEQQDTLEFIEEYQGRERIRGTGIDGINAENYESGEKFTASQIKAKVMKDHSEKIEKDKQKKKKLKNMKVKSTKKSPRSYSTVTTSKIEHDGKTYTVKTGGFDNSFGEGDPKDNWIPRNEVKQDVDPETEQLLLKKARKNK